MYDDMGIFAKKREHFISMELKYYKLSTHIYTSLSSRVITLRIIKLFRFSFFRRRIAVVQLTLEFSFYLLDRYHSCKSNSITFNNQFIIRYACEWIINENIQLLSRYIYWIYLFLKWQNILHRLKARVNNWHRKQYKHEEMFEKELCIVNLRTDTRQKHATNLSVRVPICRKLLRRVSQFFPSCLTIWYPTFLHSWRLICRRELASSRRMQLKNCRNVSRTKPRLFSGGRSSRTACVQQCRAKNWWRRERERERGGGWKRN